MVNENESGKRSLKVLLFSTMIVLSVFILILTFVVIKSIALNVTYADISPDYHSFQKAYIVDDNGIGIDSVAVFLKDNSNYNLIYKTFTDSLGQFELFNDFQSFALLNTPTSFELHTYFKGVKDTIIYKFKKHRLTHFKKVDGPDTIVINRSLLIE